MKLHTYRHSTLICLLFGLTLSACRPTTPTPQRTPTPAASAANSSSAPQWANAATCPDADFDAFLMRFSRDIAVQEASTADPLVQIQIDSEAQPEPQEVSTNVPLAEVGWPVIPNLDVARQNGREVIVTQERGDQRNVLVRTPDTDDQQRYRFAKRPCWTLVQTADDTI